MDHLISAYSSEQVNEDLEQAPSSHPAMTQSLHDYPWQTWVSGRTKPWLQQPSRLVQPLERGLHAKICKTV